MAEGAKHLMAMTIDWEPVTVDDRPVYGPTCPGPNTHTWCLTVYEGKASVSSGCSECDEVVMGPAGGEDLIMDIQVPGKLLSHLETYRGFDYVEYDHWWEFVPDD